MLRLTLSEFDLIVILGIAVPTSLKTTLIQSKTNGKSSMVKEQKIKLLVILAAFLSFLLSVYLWFSGQKSEGLFVGIWVPSILSFGTLWLMGRMPKQ